MRAFDGIGSKRVRIGFIVAISLFLLAWWGQAQFEPGTPETTSTATLLEYAREVAVIVTPDGFFPQTLYLTEGMAHRFLFTSVRGEQTVRLPWQEEPLTVRQGEVVAAQWRPEGLDQLEVTSSPGADRLEIEVIEDPSTLADVVERYEAAIIAMSGQILPARVRIPAGITVTLGGISLQRRQTVGIEGSDVELELVTSRVRTKELWAPYRGTFGLITSEDNGAARPTASLQILERDDPTWVEEGTKAPVEGVKAPDFALLNLDGRLVRLSELRGKVVFLNFWTTWCTVCKEEMPEIEKVYQQVGNSVAIFGIDLDESPATVKTYIEEGGYTFPILLDERGKVANRYRVRAIPTSFVIDKNGVIQGKHIGGMTEETIMEFIEEASQSE